MLDVAQSGDFVDEEEKGVRNRKGYGLLAILFIVLIFFVAILNKAKTDIDKSMSSSPNFRDSLKSLPSDSLLRGIVTDVSSTEAEKELEELQLYNMKEDKELKGEEGSSAEVEIESEEELSLIVAELNEKVRANSAGNNPSKDPVHVENTIKLQEAARKLILRRYGPEPYRVEMKLKFPKSMPDYDLAGTNGKIIIELGPLAYVPYSVHLFLEVVRLFKKGSFHRMAGHVTQAFVRTNEPLAGLAFQEYHSNYPHIKTSLGYAGRPGGPEFYISLVDNTNNHGPGSQGSKTEADSCFARVVEGWEDVVIKRMKKQPGGNPKSGGFINDQSNYIEITELKLLR